MIHYAKYMEGGEKRLRNDNKFISNAKSGYYFATQFRFFSIQFSLLPWLFIRLLIDFISNFYTFYTYLISKSRKTKPFERKFNQ